MTLKTPAPAPEAVPRAAQQVDLDVREDLRNGREPFSRIMTTVDGLPPGSVLHLRATFEPAPLFRVLGKKGFSHAATQNGNEDWSVWFWRATDDESAPATQHALTTNEARNISDLQSVPNTVVLDVRGLEPPEPMVLTLTALETLPAGYTLVQVNERVPQFLLPILAERGFAYEIAESHTARVLVRIRRVSQ